MSDSHLSTTIAPQPSSPPPPITSSTNPLALIPSASPGSPTIPVETMAARLSKNLLLRSPGPRARAPPSPQRPFTNRSSPQAAPVLPPIDRSSGPAVVRLTRPPLQYMGRGRGRPPPQQIGDNDEEFFLIGELLSARPPNPNSFKGFFRSIWKLSGHLSIRDSIDGRFLFVFSMDSDRRRILKGGPWKFDNAMVVLAEYDGISPIKEIALDKLGFWVDVEGLAAAYHKRNNLLRIGESLGQFVDFDNKLFNEGYVRIRVLVDLQFPMLLKGPVIMENGSVQHLEFWYENLIGRCERCGFLTHVGLPCHGIELPEFPTPIPRPEKVAVTKSEPPPLLRALMQQMKKGKGKAVIVEENTDEPPSEVPDLGGKHTALMVVNQASDQDYRAGQLRRNISAELEVADEHEVTSIPEILQPVEQTKAKSPEKTRRKVRIQRKQQPPIGEGKSKRDRDDDPMEIDQTIVLKKYKPSLAIVENSVLDGEAPPAVEVTLNALRSVAKKYKKKRGGPQGSKNKPKDQDSLAPKSEILKNKSKSRSPSKSPNKVASKVVSFPVVEYPDHAETPNMSGSAASA